MRRCRNSLRMMLGGMIFMLCAEASAVTQEDLAAMSASGMLTEATKALSAGNYDLAIPYLTEYLERMKDTEDDRVLALMQEVRLKLGKISVYLENPRGAVDWLTQYTETLPLYKPREAYKLMAVNLYELCQYEECIDAATTALTQPLPKALPKQDNEVNYDELSKDETGGLTARQLRRYEAQAKEAGEDIAEALSDGVPDPEPDYTAEEMVHLNMIMAEAYGELGKWDDSIGHFRYVVENAADQERRGYAIQKMVDALVELKRFDEAQTFIMDLCQTDARYDIRVNMTLMSIASSFSDAQEYDRALMLYRMVLPREDLVAYQERKMNELRRDAELPEVKITIITNELGRIESLFGHKFADVQEQYDAAAGLLPPKPEALLRMEKVTETLLSLPPYELDVLYQEGQAYAGAGRPWESVAVFAAVMKHDQESEIGQRAFAASLLVLVDPLKEYEGVELLGKEYLATRMSGLTPRQVAYALTMSCQKREMWGEIKNLLPTIRNFDLAEDRTILQYDCELDYMQAIADLMLLKYKEAKDGFAGVLEKYKGMHQVENASYWHAMCQLFLQHYAAAFSEYNAYADRYPEGKWLPDTVFRMGICLFGLEKYDEAEARFTQVIETWPGSPIYPDTCAMRGDLYAADGALDEAQRDYEEAIATARDAQQATYPVFQMTAMFELEERYDEILATIHAYLEQYGEEADIAKATYWTGKTKLAQGLTDEAVVVYQDTIIKYGGPDVRQDGVDLIINELVNVARSKLDDEQRQALTETLQGSLAKADSVPLRLRLRVLLASIEGRQLELGRQMIDEIDDLEQAPPPVLAMICDASFEQKNYSRGEEILRLFQNRYEDSEYMGSAYKLRGFQLFELGLYADAFDVAIEVQELFGTAPETAWAQIMKGRIQLELGDADAARTTLRTLLTVPAWRGVSCAVATYYLGEVEETVGDFRQAFAWYQRAYMQYKGYVDGYWAAEGYLASARCLKKIGLTNDMRNTYRAMLYDKYVNKLPQADLARKALGAAEAQEIDLKVAQGLSTNLTVSIRTVAEETAE